MPALFDRRVHPILVDRKLNAMPLKAESFRVYIYLAGIAERDGVAFPKVQRIADDCFSLDYTSAVTRKRHAEAAIKDLVAQGLIIKERGRQGNLLSNNSYILPDLNGVEMPERVVDAPAKLDEEWLEVVCFILKRHNNYPLLLPTDWRHIRNVVRKLQDGGVGLDLVKHWYKNVWRKQWPGNKGESPTPSQVTNGVAALAEERAGAVPNTMVVLEANDDD